MIAPYGAERSSSNAAPCSTPAPRLTARARASATSRDLPIPASPVIRTVVPWPACSCSIRRPSLSISRSRPIVMGQTINSSSFGLVFISVKATSAAGLFHARQAGALRKIEQISVVSTEPHWPREAKLATRDQEYH